MSSGGLSASLNEDSQSWNLLFATNAILQVAPERDAEFAAGLLQACKRVATAAAIIAARPPLILRRLTYSRMSPSLRLLCKGRSGRSNTSSSSRLLRCMRLRARLSDVKHVSVAQTASKRYSVASLAAGVGSSW